jgi:hypothetical protein
LIVGILVIMTVVSLQVAAMGFEVEAVKAALCHHRGNVRRVTEELLSWGGGQLPAEWIQAYEKYQAHLAVKNTSGALASGRYWQLWCKVLTWISDGTVKKYYCKKLMFRLDEV